MREFNKKIKITLKTGKVVDGLLSFQFADSGDKRIIVCWLLSNVYAGHEAPNNYGYWNSWRFSQPLYDDKQVKQFMDDLRKNNNGTYFPKLFEWIETKKDGRAKKIIILDNDFEEIEL